MNNEKECLSCREIVGTPKYYECKNCSYFVCEGCSATWINKNCGHFKCFYGCRSVNNFVSSIRYNDNIIAKNIMTMLDNVAEQMMKLLFSCGDSNMKIVMYITMSFIVTFLIIVPGMMIISLVTIRSQEGQELFKYLTFPVAGSVLAMCLVLSFC